MVRVVAPLRDLFIPRSQSSLYETAVQSCIATPRLLALLVAELVCVADQFGCVFQIHVEPHGDGCESGNWVDVEIDSGVYWAEVTPWPNANYSESGRHTCQAVLPSGWVFADPDVNPNHFEASDCDRSPRLVGHRSTDCIERWSDAIISFVGTLFDVPACDWFFTIFAYSLPGGELEKLGSSWDMPVLANEWSVDALGLACGVHFRRAIWPSGSESAHLACDQGLHDLHEPPCGISSPLR